jgi:CPA1 family monovalent cation:H+ antiporter
MSLFEVFAILITLSALFSYLNLRLIRLPTTIGLMLMALVLSLSLVLLGGLSPYIEEGARSLLSRVDFSTTLLHGMLAFLLFAGSLHVDLNDLYKHKWVIGWLATLGVLLSTALVGGLAWLIFNAFDFQLSLLYCLLFGALIAPTDPIAVMGILRKANVPKSLETKIIGESLFNDGVGVVVFLVLYRILVGKHEVTAGEVAGLFLAETVGGIMFGLAIGYLAYRMLKSVDRYQVEVLITLAVVAGGYALAERLHISAPIAIVVAGLLLGNHGRVLAMSEQTCEHLDTFWELIDEVLNAVLFVLIGLEVLILDWSHQYAWVVLLAIPVVLLVRLVGVWIPVALFRYFKTFSPGVIRILTWGGLRGGISVAMALSLPAGESRDLILLATYAVVVFSVIVQGLSIERVVRTATQSENQA